MKPVNYRQSARAYAAFLSFCHGAPVDWSALRALTWDQALRAKDRSLNLGAMSGKTTAIVAFASIYSDSVVICKNADYAHNLSKRYPAVRTLSTAEIIKLPSTQFDSTAPLFIFDDVDSATTVLGYFKPARYALIGECS